MKPMYQTISDVATSPVTGLTVTGSVAGANFFGIGLPEIIQLSTAVYAVLLAVDKIWKMYKDWKSGKDESEE